MKCHRTLAAVALLGLAPASWAASGFGISPLRLDLSAAKPMASYVLTNSGDVPVVIQAQPRAWRQEQGRDVLGDTRAFLVNPAIVRLQPGESQVIRVALRAAPDRERETGYRMHFTEVPQADEPAKTEGAMSVRLVKRMDLPVFVAPVAGEPRPRGALKASVEGTTLRLLASNDGTGHWRLGDLVVADAATGSVLGNPLVVSVLPGGMRAVEIPLKNGATPAAVTVKGDAGGEAFEARIPVEKDR